MRRRSSPGMTTCSPSSCPRNWTGSRVSLRSQPAMTTKDLTFTAQIRGTPERIFDLVADMPNYGRWLPDSSAFGGTIDVKPYPVQLGTTYLDAGPIEKPGEVTEFDRPNHISFHHIVQIRRPFHA